MAYLVASVHWGVARVVQVGDQDPAWGDVVDLGECMGFRGTVEVVLGPRAIPGKVRTTAQRQ